MANKYREYFDIDEQYFPQINETTIQKARWDNTYPHETFVKLLVNICGMLDGKTKRSIWIHGSYGTGKSQCAFALKKILEVPASELQAYWKKYEPLQKQEDLLTKLIGHKQRKIVTAYRYGSGGINSTRDLLLAVQESVKSALIQQGVAYKGENTLKESVIAWIDEPTRKTFFNNLLKKPEHSAIFAQSSADEVLNALRKGDKLNDLMGNIFTLAEQEGITALNLDTERLISWLKDILAKNDIKIVLVWDEFSAYLKSNRNSLDQFQKLAELCEEKFYFIIVTHETGAIVNNADQAWRVVQQRFEFSEIKLPDNIAFDLINHAFSVKPAAKESWKALANDLNGRLSDSRNAVIKEAKISDPDILKGIMPIHPVAALILKNIASAFQSNQRSMFDFIKSENEDVKAFQWFIENTGPEDDHPLLTVDQLWNFFYEKGRNNLTSDIQSILDTFPRQQNLDSKQQAVLKSVLIMQAIDYRLGGSVELFRVTDKNLAYAFEGINDIEGNTAVNIAKHLVTEGILYRKPIGNGIEVFAAAALTGDQRKIDEHKEKLQRDTTTATLVVEGGLSTVLSLSPPLRLRFESEAGTGKLRTVTIKDFTNVIKELSGRKQDWRFNAVIAFAKDDGEAANFRKTIKEAVKNIDYKDIIFIDALSTPLGTDAFEQYVDFSAMAMAFSRNEDKLSQNYSDKAKRVLDQEWKNRIASGTFILYSHTNQEGERYQNVTTLFGALQNIVTSRFEFAFDFAKGLTENMLKFSQGKASAKCGITQTSSGAIVVIERHIIPTVWKVDKYWEHQYELPISKIKLAIEEKIDKAFNSDGQISIRDIYTLLEEEYGFAPCNMSAFLTGFLLKEYANDTYRYVDSNGKPEPMSVEKLAEMIDNYIKDGNNPRYKDTFLVKMTPQEMAFYELSEKVFRIPPCSSVNMAVTFIQKEMKNLGLPIWCLSEVDDYGIYHVIERYIKLIQTEGKDTHAEAVEIGKIKITKPTIADKLVTLVTKEKCQEGMRAFLVYFEDGKISALAKEIGAESNLLDDIQTLFAVKYSCLWDRPTGEDEIRKLLTEYGIVRESNIILSTSANSLQTCFKAWRERLKFVHVSCEAATTKYPLLANLFDILYKIATGSEILPEWLKTFRLELLSNGQECRNFLGDEKKIFSEVYAPYLEGLSEDEIGDIKGKLPVEMFTSTASDCNIKVKECAEQFRKGQLKTKLFTTWQNRTDTKNPYDWSVRYKMPILAMVSDTDFDKAKKCFETLNRNNQSEAEIETALDYIEKATFFDDLNDSDKRNSSFKKKVIGDEYSVMLSDIQKIQNDLDRLSIDAYDWLDNPSVKSRIKGLAEAEYKAGGSDKALKAIEVMDDANLKVYLKQLVKENMTVGIEIIRNEGK